MLWVEIAPDSSNTGPDKASQEANCTPDMNTCQSALGRDRTRQFTVKASQGNYCTPDKTKVYQSAGENDPREMIVPVRSVTRTDKTTKGRLTQPGTPGCKLTTEVSADRISFTGHYNEAGLSQDLVLPGTKYSRFYRATGHPAGLNIPESNAPVNRLNTNDLVHQFSGHPVTGMPVTSPFFYPTCWYQISPAVNTTFHVIR